MLAATDWAYLAAFVDGEGCIRGIKRKDRHPLHPRLIVVNTNIEVLEDLKALFGVGTLYLRDPRRRAKHVRGDWNIFRQHEVKWLLRGMYPYLRIKREQAEIAYILLQLSPRNRHELTQKLSDLKRRN